MTGALAASGSGNVAVTEEILGTRRVQMHLTSGAVMSRMGHGDPGFDNAGRR